MPLSENLRRLIDLNAPLWAQKARGSKMQLENWTAIQNAQAVSLEDADRALLDTLQARLGLHDREFLHFMSLIGKLAPAASVLRRLHLPKG